MSEISAPPPPGPSSLPPLPAALPSATTLPPAQTQIPIPQAFIDAAIGARFDAQIINLSHPGLITLQGDFGRVQLQLQSPMPLSQGDTLTFQLGGRGSLLQFIITSVNGAPTELSARAGAATATGGLLGPIAAANSGAPPFQPGNFLSATLLRPQPGLFGGAPTTAQTPLGPTTAPTPAAQPFGPTAAPGQSAGLTSPGTVQATPSVNATPSGNSALASSSGPGATPSAAGSQISGSSPGTTATLPAGTRFTVQITAVQPPPPGGASAVTPPTGQGIVAQGQILTGIVSGATTGGGQAIVETVLGPIALNGSYPPIEGTRLSLTITSAPQPPVPAEPSGNNQQLFLRQALFLNRHWPALNETIQTLEQVAPNAAMQVAHTAMARPDANLAANIIFFLTALRGGDLRSWLGDQSIRVLQRANPGLLGRLSDDMKQQTRIAEERPAGDWRMAMVPFHNGEALDQIRLLTRRQEEEEGDDPESAATRFVVDVNLTKLGHIQLDGLINKGRHRMDMVVRSDSHLSPDIKNDIRTLYENSGEITGYRGGVGFQSQPANFIEIEPPAETNSGVGLTV